MRSYLKLILLCVLGVSLSACDQSDKPLSKKTEDHTQTIVVKKEKTLSHLYFQGLVAPLNVTSINTPLEGIIEAKYFNYGDTVEQGAVLFRIQSEAFEKEYQTAFSEYLKAQENFSTNTDKARSNKELWDAGLIPRNDYQTQVNAAAEASLSLKLAQQKLFHLLKTAGVLDETATKNLLDKLQSLAITDIDGVNQAINLDVSHLKVRAPKSGIVLIATQQDTSQSSARKEMTVGLSVKPQETLALIGNMSGIKIKIKVNEIDINHLKIGQAATVTGSAFPGVNLQGEIITLNAQAGDEGAGSLPTFPVTVRVNSLSEEQQKQIHVGMSTQVKITLSSIPMISLPIKAVKQQGNDSLVTVRDPKTKKTKTIKVITGKTSLEKVIILEGLKEGDHVVIDHPTP